MTNDPTYELAVMALTFCGFVFALAAIGAVIETGERILRRWR
jgi:hypothetical protein